MKVREYPLGELTELEISEGRTERTFSLCSHMAVWSVVHH